MPITLVYHKNHSMKHAAPSDMLPTNLLRCPGGTIAIDVSGNLGEAFAKLDEMAETAQQELLPLLLYDIRTKDHGYTNPRLNMENPTALDVVPTVNTLILRMKRCLYANPENHVVLQTNEEHANEALVKNLESCGMRFTQYVCENNLRPMVPLCAMNSIRAGIPWPVSLTKEGTGMLPPWMCQAFLKNPDGLHAVMLMENEGNAILIQENAGYPQNMLAAEIPAEHVVWL